MLKLLRDDKYFRANLIWDAIKFIFWYMLVMWFLRSLVIEVAVAIASTAIATGCDLGV